jgi:drug/metabolite transporter (DMT)-like permease
MNNLRGIMLVVAAMAAFTLEDSFIKNLSASVPVGQVLILLGLGSASLFALMARIQGQSVFMPRAWRMMPMARAFMEAIAATGFAGALSLIEISTVAAVFQVTPLAITMGAALFLGEQVGWRRWSAVCVGFIGVLMIIRPGMAAFDPAALLVLIAVLGVAARDLMTRVMDAAIPSSVISFQGFLMLVPAGIALLFLLPGETRMLQGLEWAQIVGGMVFGMLGYYGIVAAMRIADASAVTPFRYTRLLFSLLVGMIVFRERPDLMTLCGAGLIIASGLYTVWREQRVARRERRARAAAA